MHDYDSLSRDDLIRRLHEQPPLDSVLQATDVMLVLLDPAFNFVWVNAAYAATCQMTPEAMRGKNHFDLYPSAETETLFRRVRDTREPLFCKDRPFVFPDQPERGITYWDWSLKPVTDAQDILTGLVFSLRETTRFKQAEDARHASEARLHLFIEHAPAALAMFDRDMRYLAVSRRWLTDYRLTDTDLIGRSHYEVFPEIPEEWRANHRRGLAGEVLEGGEHPLTRPDGRVQWQRWAIRPWLASDGTVGGIVIFTEDVTARKEAELALQRANRYNRGLLEVCLDPLVVIDPQGRISDVNAATEAATGHPREHLIGTDFAEYFTQPERAQTGYRQVFNQGQVRDYALELQHRDGRITPVLYNAAVYRDAEGEVEQVFAAARDVSALQRLTDMLKARLRLLDQARDQSLEAVLQASIDEAAALTGSLIGFYHFLEPDQETLLLQTWSTRTIREFCRAEGAGLHYPLSEAGLWADCVRERRAIIHNDYAALPQRRGLPEGHAEVIRELVAPVFRGGRIVAILGVGNKPHDYDADDLHIVTTFADLAWDIVEQKRAQSALRQMAHFDALTGLPNRVLLHDRLHIALANARRDQHLLAVCYLDLDDFKPVNDTYGHAAGDRLLVMVAERMTQILREGDTVARLGGDEFALLLVNPTSLEQAEQTLKRLLEALAEPFALDQSTAVRVSGSIGMTVYPFDPSDAEMLMRHADQAMYEAKQAGRNCFRRFQGGT